MEATTVVPTENNRELSLVIGGGGRGGGDDNHMKDVAQHADSLPKFVQGSPTLTTDNAALEASTTTTVPTENNRELALVIGGGGDGNHMKDVAQHADSLPKCIEERPSSTPKDASVVAIDRLQKASSSTLDTDQREMTIDELHGAGKIFSLEDILRAFASKGKEDTNKYENQLRNVQMENFELAKQLEIEKARHLGYVEGQQVMYGFMGKRNESSLLSSSITKPAESMLEPSPTSKATRKRSTPAKRQRQPAPAKRVKSVDNLKLPAGTKSRPAKGRNI